MARFTPRTTERERDVLCMVGHKRERVLGRVGRAVNAAARDFAREASQLENGGGREAAAERLVEQQFVCVVASVTCHKHALQKSCGAGVAERPSARAVNSAMVERCSTTANTYVAKELRETAFLI